MVSCSLELGAAALFCELPVTRQSTAEPVGPTISPVIGVTVWLPQATGEVLQHSMFIAYSEALGMPPPALLFFAQSGQIAGVAPGGRKTGANFPGASAWLGSPGFTANSCPTTPPGASPG